MIKEGRFGIQEAVWLITITISAKVFFASSATVAAIVGTAGWYMTIISATVALVGFLIIHALLKCFPGKDLVEIFNLSLGRLVGFAFSGVLAAYLLFTAITRLSEFNEVTRVYVFPLSPNSYIIGFFVISVCTLSYLGLESMARLARLLAPPMVLGFFFVLVVGIQNYRINNIYPLLGYGLKKTVSTGIIRSSGYGEIIILAIFSEAFQGLKYIKREGLIGLGLSAFFISMSLLAFTLTFPYYTAREFTAPMYELAGLIDFGRVLQRVESIFLFLWNLSTLISTTVVFYGFVRIFCKMFRIPDKGPVILGGGIILYAGSLMHRDITSTILGGVELIRRLGSVVFFVLPFLALIVATIRKMGVKKSA